MTSFSEKRNVKQCKVFVKGLLGMQVNKSVIYARCHYYSGIYGMLLIT